MNAERTASILTAVGDRFPLYANASGTWHTTRRGSWAGGFWVGLLRLHADPALVQHWAKKLAAWVDADTVTRGLIFWYGGDEDLARQAAKTMAARFDADAGVIPWGTAFGENGLRTRVDGVAGTVPLLAWAGEREIAAAHLRTHLRLAGNPAWEMRSGTWRPMNEPPQGWTRGEAWLLLATADGARWLGEEFHMPGHALAQRWLDQHGTTAPRATASVDAPVDTSAAAIAAVALLKLGYINEGRAILHNLVDKHTVDGRLLNGCYDLSNGVATSNELIWGTYFLAVGLELLEDPTSRCADM